MHGSDGDGGGGGGKLPGSIFVPVFVVIGVAIITALLVLLCMSQRKYVPQKSVNRVDKERAAQRKAAFAALGVWKDSDREKSRRQPPPTAAVKSVPVPPTAHCATLHPSGHDIEPSSGKSSASRPGTAGAERLHSGAINTAGGRSRSRSRSQFLKRMFLRICGKGEMDQEDPGPAAAAVAFSSCLPDTHYDRVIQCGSTPAEESDEKHRTPASPVSEVHESFFRRPVKYISILSRNARSSLWKRETIQGRLLLPDRPNRRKSIDVEGQAVKHGSRSGGVGPAAAQGSTHGITGLAALAERRDPGWKAPDCWDVVEASPSDLPAVPMPAFLRTNTGLNLETERSTNGKQQTLPSIRENVDISTIDPSTFGIPYPFASGMSGGGGGGGGGAQRNSDRRTTARWSMATSEAGTHTRRSSLARDSVFCTCDLLDDIQEDSRRGSDTRRAPQGSSSSLSSAPAAAGGGGGGGTGTGKNRPNLRISIDSIDNTQRPMCKACMRLAGATPSVVTPRTPSTPWQRKAGGNHRSLTTGTNASAQAPAAIGRTSAGHPGASSTQRQPTNALSTGAAPVPLHSDRSERQSHRRTAGHENSSGSRPALDPQGRETDSGDGLHGTHDDLTTTTRKPRKPRRHRDPSKHPTIVAGRLYRE